MSSTVVVVVAICVLWAAHARCDADIKCDVAFHSQEEHLGKDAYMFVQTGVHDIHNIINGKSGDTFEPHNMSQRGFLFGSWHKSGTVLLMQLVAQFFLGDDISVSNSMNCNEHEILSLHPYRSKAHCSSSWLNTRISIPNALCLNLNIDFYNRFDVTVSKKFGAAWRGVQIIRHPIDMILSGYTYGLRHWEDCNGCDCVTMKDMNISTGLSFYAHCAIIEIELMVNMTHIANTDSRMLVLRLEDFTNNSDSFDTQVERMYEHLTIECGVHCLNVNNDFLIRSSMYDLNRHPESAEIVAGHVTPAELKHHVQSVYTTLQTSPIMLRAQGYASTLGYA